MQGSSRQNLILIVVGNSDEHLGMPVVHRRAEVISMVQSEFVRVARSCRVYQVLLL
jgi:hypothetical protein